MPNTTIGNIFVCVDCMIWAENGDHDGIPAGKQVWCNELPGDGNPTCNWGSDDDDDDDGVINFNRESCDACGDNLAGARYRYMLWEA